MLAVVAASCGLEAAKGDELSSATLLHPLGRVRVCGASSSIAGLEADVDPAYAHACSLSPLAEDVPNHAVDQQT